MDIWNWKKLKDGSTKLILFRVEGYDWKMMKNRDNKQIFLK